VTGRRVTRGAQSEGFSLIELMVVMALIVVLASLGLTLYTNSVNRTKEAVLRENLFRMRDAIDQYYADRNRYPATLDALVTDGYMRAVPEDPMTESADTWVVTMSAPNLQDLAQAPGVFNVRSGSDQAAMDGTPFAEF
jgi:general secretion pathway protein G